MEKTRIMPKGHWDWSMPVPFSQGWMVGDLIFVGGQISVDENHKILAPGDIAGQTRNVFDNIRKVLNEVGADMEDIVKFNTYYIDNQAGEEVKDFWQEMTNVRMEYFSEPGPAGTAIRCSGFATEGILIEVEAIAVLPKHTQANNN